MNFKRLGLSLLMIASWGAVMMAQDAPASVATDSIPSMRLHEVTVTSQAASRRMAETALGSERLELGKLALTPQLFGEKDIIKAMTLLPGVHGEADGAGGFEVRGGNSYQNLVSVDGMTVYNPAHLMGIFSTFNDDAIGGATLHKGPLPARFGGASSSVLDVTMAPGDMDRYSFSGTVGLLNAKVAADGPVVKDRLSFALAARRSYFDLFLKCVPRYRSTVLHFYDVNAKIRFLADSRNTVDATFFMARDRMGIGDLMDASWGNLAGSLRWMLRASGSWRLTSTISATRYNTDMSDDIMGRSERMKGHIRSLEFDEKADFIISPDHRIGFGLRSELLTVLTGEGWLNSLHTRDLHSGWQNALWAGYEGKVIPTLSLSAGLRGVMYSVVTGRGLSGFIAPEEQAPDFSPRNYFSLEPRATLKLDFGGCHNLKLGAGVSTQNIHGIRSTFTSFPMDRYALTSASVKPERSTLYSAGYAGMSRDGAFDWSAELYYRSIGNVYDYRDGMSMFSRISLESIIAGGKGKGYGLELMLRKNTGRLSGWVAYTLAKSLTRIDGINGGRWYDASNDRRHNVSIVALYTLSPRWNLSAAWTYSSGHPITAPDAKYSLSGTTVYYYSRRNGYRTPASHRLDLSATYTRVGRRVTSVVAFGVFNAYSHQSPFVVYFEDDPSKPSGTRAVQQSLFGLLPFVSYTIKF